MMKYFLGISAVSPNSFYNTLKLMHPHIEDMPKEQTKTAKDDMKLLDKNGRGRKLGTCCNSSCGLDRITTVGLDRITTVDWTVSPQSLQGNAHIHYILGHSYQEGIIARIVLTL